jgi:tetratricopeptide (TPR) repeat protein
MRCRNLSPFERLNVIFVVLVLVCTESAFALAGADPPQKQEVKEAVEKAATLYRQFKTQDALKQLKRALAIDPDDPEALIWTARAYLDLGDMTPTTASDWQDKRKEYYRTAEGYAQKAMKLDPNSTWGHFYVAVAMAKIASLSSVKKQIELAYEIRKQVDKSIALDPDNGFAYHLLGVWHRRMAEIGSMKRFMALVFMQGSVPKGSMEKAVQYLKKAISYNPRVITHHLELAKTYVDLGKIKLAEKHLREVETLPVRFSDDYEHKKEAKELLEKLEKDRDGSK